jgi:hypothetical protein
MNEKYNEVLEIGVVGLITLTNIDTNSILKVFSELTISLH